MGRKGKRKLALSVWALVLCVSMLAGTTFAWFTDTSVAAVAQIRSGVLDVALEMSVDGGATWQNAEGQTLQFCRKDGTSEGILWEPGCSYWLPLLRVVNRGDLALKYQLVLEGIQGVEKLTEVLEWDVNGEALETAGSLAPGGATQPIRVQAHMREDAGNAYQGLQLTGVTVAVYAYQDAVEYDSFGNQYDALAGPLNGKVRLLRNEQLVEVYEDLQGAVAAAQPGDTLELTGNMEASGLVAVDKDLTIDGKGYRVVRGDYAGTLLRLEQGVALVAKNLTLDGGAYDFKIDFSLNYPAVEAASLAEEPRATESMLVSYGYLTADSLHFVNHCTETSGASPLKLLQGTAVLRNCDFTHNYGHSLGGAVHIGEAFTQDQTDYALDQVRFENCTFSRNYTRYGNGGAVVARFAREVRFVSCDFTQNVAASYCAGGGAVLFFRDGLNDTERNGLIHIQGVFEDCIFRSNYSGNDGFAINNECGELTVRGCEFIGNVGLSGNSAVGTISEMHYSDTTLDTWISDCLFRDNRGACAVYGDHGSPHDIVMQGCTFTGNDGAIDILLYCSDASISDCGFVNEKITTTLLDVRAYTGPSDAPAYQPPVVELTNISVSGGIQPRGVLIRRYGHDMSKYAPTVNVYGMNTADIHVWDDGRLNLYGTLSGEILSDGVTSPDSVVIMPGAIHNGTYRDE